MISQFDIFNYMSQNKNIDLVKKWLDKNRLKYSLIRETKTPTSELGMKYFYTVIVHGMDATEMTYEQRKEIRAISYKNKFTFFEIYTRESIKRLNMIAHGKKTPDKLPCCDMCDGEGYLLVSEKPLVFKKCSDCKGTGGFK